MTAGLPPPEIFKSMLITFNIRDLHQRYWVNLILIRCMQEGRGFKTWWGELIFSIYLFPPAILGPGVHSASNRNEYQKQKSNVSGE
jgi:hypothetical protein